MSELVTHLIARGLSGRETPTEARLLAWLEDPGDNRRVFGQPLPETLWYYRGEFADLFTTVHPNAKPPTFRKGPGRPR